MHAEFTPTPHMLIRPPASSLARVYPIAFMAPACEKRKVRNPFARGSWQMEESRRSGFASCISLVFGLVLLMCGAIAPGCSPNSTTNQTASVDTLGTASNFKEGLAGAAGSTPSIEPASEPLTPASFIVGTAPWTLDLAPGEIISTLHFRIYTTSRKSVLIDNMPAFLETAFSHYTSALLPLPRPSNPMEIYLLDTRAQWERQTQRFMGDGAGPYLQIQRGGFTYDGRGILYDIGRRDTFAITAHEGWHVYTQSTFKNALPVYLEEGLATYMEGFRWDPASVAVPTFFPWANFERFDGLRNAVRNNRLMPLSKIAVSTPQQLITNDPDSALVYYAQVWALIHFLNEGENGLHAAKLRTLVSDAASGRLVPTIRKSLGDRAASAYAYRRRGVDLLKLYFDQSPEEMDAAYTAFVNSIVQTGTRQDIWRGKSPVTTGSTRAPGKAIAPLPPGVGASGGSLRLTP